MADGEDLWLAAAQRVASPLPAAPGSEVALRQGRAPHRRPSGAVDRPPGGLGPGIGRWPRRPCPHVDGGMDPGGAAWWWLGVHGGAGVSTLAGLIPGGADAFRLWPDPDRGPQDVVLVCRTHMHGLDCARAAVSQWAGHGAPEGLRVLGLVAVADAPGRLPRPQAQALRLLAGAVDRLWPVGYVEALRVTSDLRGMALPPPMAQLAAALDSVRGRYEVRL